MLFNSYVFMLVFLPAVLAGWWLLPSKQARLLFLTLASYVFYGWWDYRFVPLLIISTSADYWAGQRIAAESSEHRRKGWLAGLLVFNLGILAIFKYYDFFIGSMNGLARQLGASTDFPLLHIILPIGISFYTFNSISYTIDIYRRRLEPTRSFLEFSAFVAMFPHLVAGPIVRYADMDRQFARLRDRPLTGEIVTGVWFLVIGMAKKVLIADVVANAYVTPLFGHSGSLGFIDGWTAALAYTTQIYFDFSGYSDMAVGLALLMGFHFPQNFNCPYQAGNISQFWRRWHMSLSFWLRDYLFIPLGGSRGSRWMTARNLAITMFLGGLWHGAAWTFVVWGLYHGLLLAGHTIAKQRRWTLPGRGLNVALTLILVIVGWVVFRAASMSEATQVFSAMAGLQGIGATNVLFGDAAAALVLIGGLAIALFARDTWTVRLPRSAAGAVLAAAVLVLCMLRFAHPSPFLYFQF